MARGDRKVGNVILNVYKKGAIFDSWSEYFDNQKWMDAFEECNVSMDFYTTRERSTEEIFPWDFIDCGVTKEFLKREWEKAQREEISQNCRKQCQGCGAARFGGGVCFS